jgi:hypothetical protein
VGAAARRGGRALRRDPRPGSLLPASARNAAQRIRQSAARPARRRAARAPRAEKDPSAAHARRCGADGCAAGQAGRKDAALLGHAAEMLARQGVEAGPFPPQTLALVANAFAKLGRAPPAPLLARLAAEVRASRAPWSAHALGTLVNAYRRCPRPRPPRSKPTPQCPAAVAWGGLRLRV